MAQTASDTLFSARLMVGRAKHHLADLQAAIRAFFDTGPYKVATKRDPQTRKLIYHVASVEEVPASIPVIAGDVIQNLRNSLDHLAYQLFLAGTGGAGASGSHVYFPVGNGAADYQTSKIRKVQGMRHDAILAIDAVEPYKGGKGHQLWVLHKLNNIHKHRLVVTVGSAFRSIDLGAHMSRLLQQQIRQARQADPAYPVPDPSTMHVFFRTSPMSLCPLKPGDELFVDAPDAEVNDQIQFRFDIAISEAGILEGESLLETLHQVANLVDDLLGQFAPLL
jgi:hypothetical protein